MEMLLDFFVKEINQTSSYPLYIHIAMILCVMLSTQGLKTLFIKKYTNKIDDKITKEEINTVIIYIAFGIGILLNFVLTFLGYDFCYKTGISWGALSQIVYIVLERNIRIIVKGIKSKIESGKTVQKDAETAISEVKEKENEFLKLVEAAKEKLKKGGE